MSQNQKRQVQTMRIYYNTAKKYEKPTPIETGRPPKYDIREIPHSPRKTHQVVTGGEQQASSQTTQKKNAGQKKHDNAMQEWPQYKTKLGEALKQIYTRSKKQTHPKEPEWATRSEEWGKNKKYSNCDMPTRQEQHSNKNSTDAIRISDARRSASNYSKYYKNGRNHLNTPRTMPARSSMPEAPLLT